MGDALLAFYSFELQTRFYCQQSYPIEMCPLIVDLGNSMGSVGNLSQISNMLGSTPIMDVFSLSWRKKKVCVMMMMSLPIGMIEHGRTRCTVPSWPWIELKIKKCATNTFIHRFEIYVYHFLNILSVET